MHELYWDVQSEVRSSCYSKSTTWLCARSRLHQYSSTLSVLESCIGLSRACARQINHVLSMVVYTHMFLHSCTALHCTALRQLRHVDMYMLWEENSFDFTVHHVILRYTAARHVCFWQHVLSLSQSFSAWKCGRSRVQCGFPSMHHTCESGKTNRKAVQGACADTCRVKEHLIDTTTTSSWDEQIWRLTNDVD